MIFILPLLLALAVMFLVILGFFMAAAIYGICLGFKDAKAKGFGFKKYNCKKCQDKGMIEEDGEVTICDHMFEL